MSFVALGAIILGDLFRMRLVALGAGRFYPMDTMAGGAEKRRMLALVLSELLILILVASEARIGRPRREGDIERRMRVPVATKTSLQLKVGFPTVTHGALWNIVFRGRTMPGMAVLAGEPGVLPTGRSYVGRLGGMAFNAIGC